MESSGNSLKDLVDDSVSRFNELKAKARDLQKKMGTLEKEEGEVGEVYDNIFKAVYVQLGFFVTFSSCLVALFIKELAPYWMTSVIACVSFCFVIGVVCPVAFAYRQLSGLKYTSKKLTEERSKIQERCVSLLNVYTQILVFVSNLSNKQDLENEGNGDRHNENFVSNISDSDDGDDLDSDDLRKDGLLKDIIDFQIEKLEEFRREDIVPKFWKKHNRKYILAVGLCCLMFTVMVLLYAIYKTKSQAVPALAPLPSPTTFGLLLKDHPALFARPETDISSLSRKMLM